MQITNVLEDVENYYVDYEYNTLAIRDNAWQEITRTGTLTVSKQVLIGQDLGLYVAEELGEIIDSQLAYLKEVQEIENKKGQTFVRQTVQYTALLGLILDPETRQLPGYEPVIQLPEPMSVQVDPDSTPDKVPESVPDLMDPAPIPVPAPEPVPVEPVPEPIGPASVQPELVCDAANLNLCATEADCQNIEGFWYNETCNAEPEKSLPTPY